MDKLESREIKMLSKLMKNSRKIVIKIGSNILSNEDGTINHSFIEQLCEQVSFNQRRETDSNSYFRRYDCRN